MKVNEKGHYACEVCGAVFLDREAAEGCKRVHLRITDECMAAPIYIEREDAPQFIEITFPKGEKVSYIRT